MIRKPRDAARVIELIDRRERQLSRSVKARSPNLILVSNRVDLIGQRKKHPRYIRVAYTAHQGPQEIARRAARGY
jgi:hypothetical protein